MSKTRITLITLLSGVLLFWIAHQRQQDSLETYECHVLPDKLVINTFENDVLIRSFSLSSDKQTFGEWRRGMKAPHYQRVSTIKRDYTPSEIPNHKRLRLYTNRMFIAWDADVSNECFDAI